jgi:hypothetical protein
MYREGSTSLERLYPFEQIDEGGHSGCPDIRVRSSQTLYCEFLCLILLLRKAFQKLHLTPVIREFLPALEAYKVRARRRR